MSVTVHSDDSAWLMRFEYDSDGVYPIEWLELGFRREPPREIREELERKAFSYFHQRRAGVDTHGDEE